MEVRSYNSELAIANILFKRIFSNIIIDRVDRKTGEKKQIPVSCVLDQKSRVLKNWENAEKRAMYKIPMITVSRTGYQRAPDRVNGQNNEVKYEISSKNRNQNLLTPVPVDISYDVTVIAKYPSDIDQIASNFMVFFNSDIYVSCMHPKYDGVKMNSQIVMSDSIQEEHSGEIDSTTDDLITATFQFTYKTYLFGGTQQAKLVPSKVISSFLSSYTATEVSVLGPNEASSYIQSHPNASISVAEKSSVTSVLTALVDNPNLSTDVYDGFVPIINEIDVGFYPTPWTSGHVEQMETVDNYPLSVQPYYCERLVWTIDT